MNSSLPVIPPSGRGAVPDLWRGGRASLPAPTTPLHSGTLRELPRSGRRPAGDVLVLRRTLCVRCWDDVGHGASEAVALNEAAQDHKPETRRSEAMGVARGGRVAASFDGPVSSER